MTMKETQFSRTEQLIGTENVKYLSQKSVAIFGLGGVGGHAIDALVRSGIGKVLLVDFDVITLSNINRQLIANHETLGRKKVEVMKEHLLKINPKLIVETYDLFYEEDSPIDFSMVSYVIDAIDSLKSKISLITFCKKNHIPIISAMGAGNKLDPLAFEVTDISKTSVCPLAKRVRQELKKQNIDSLKVVYSKESNARKEFDYDENHHIYPSSIAFVPSVMGLILASEVIKDLIKEKGASLCGN